MSEEKKCRGCGLTLLSSTVKSIGIPEIISDGDCQFVPPKGDFCMKTDSVPCLRAQLAEAKLANERLRTVCAEWAEDVLLAVGMLETEGPRKGWHSSMARSEAVEAGDYLSLGGTWEIHPDGGNGKMQWYRRKEQSND